MRITPTGMVVKSSRKNSANDDTLESKSEVVPLDATAAADLFVAGDASPQKGMSSAQTDVATAAATDRNAARAIDLPMTDLGFSQAFMLCFSLS